MKKQRYVGVRRSLIAVRRMLDEPEGQFALRRALDDALPGGVTCRMSDAAVLEQASAMLEGGRMRLFEREPLEGVLDLDWAEEPPPSAKEPTEKAEKKVALTWIEIRLIGEDGKPIPGERYRITLPDGSTREGSLDGKGRARVDGIEPGQCEVTFPALDREAWVRA